MGLNAVNNNAQENQDRRKEKEKQELTFCDSRCRRVRGEGKGGDPNQSLNRSRGRGSLVQEGAVLHVLREFLEKGKWLVEVNRHGDLGQILSHELFDDTPQADFTAIKHLSRENTSPRNDL